MLLAMHGHGGGVNVIGNACNPSFEHDARDLLVLKHNQPVLPPQQPQDAHVLVPAAAGRVGAAN